MRGVLKTSILISVFLSLFGLGVFLSAQFMPQQKTIDVTIDKPVVVEQERVKPGITNFAMMGQDSLLDKAYKAAESYESEEPIRAIIVNHHLLAADLVAAMFLGVDAERIKKIILISPDHFGRSETLASTTNAYWQTPYGGVYAHDDVELLLTHSEVSLDNDAVNKDHGVSNIIPFIKRSIPEADIIPLTINDLASLEEVRDFSQKMLPLIDDETLMVASFDFSHDATHLSSRFHDEHSVSVLLSGDAERAYRADIDARPGMALLIELMNAHGNNFHLVERNDSSVYTNNPFQQDVTSYITGYYSAAQNNAEQSVQVMISGDVMMDRFIRTLMEERGNHYPFEQLGRFMYGSDINLVNLEGTITNNSTQAGEEENLNFTFAPVSTEVLQQASVNVVSLANNHTQDFGNAGLQQTKDYLASKGVDYFGDYFNQEEISYVEQVGESSIAFIGYHQFSNVGNELVIDEIMQKSQQNDFVIVYAHWGAEYHMGITESQQSLAYSFVDAGANIVIGAHPHVVQPLELYNGVPIVYSLGNFVFDQAQIPEVTIGLSVGLSLSESQNRLYLFPIQMNKQYQPTVMHPEQALSWYEDYANKAINLPLDLTKSLKAGILNY